MTPKWRPSLAFVLGGALAGTLTIALLGLVLLRYLGPEIGFRNAATLIAIAIGLLTAVCAWLLVRLLLRPIKHLAQYAGDVRRGDQEASPPRRFGTHEIRGMAASVIDMAEAFKTREATIRSYSDHITHELKNPVSTVIAASELLQDSDLTDADRNLVDQVENAAKQMNEQLDALRRVVRAREADYRGQSSLSDVLPSLRGKYGNLEIDGLGQNESVPISADGFLLILDHMVSNADAHGATKVRIRAAPQSIEIRDNGQGIAEGDLDRIFEPLYTTRRDAGGTGMGLAIVRSILSAHGGVIEIVPDEDGAVFKIDFKAQ